MKHLLPLLALLALASHAEAGRRGDVSGYDQIAPRHGYNVVTGSSQGNGSGKRGKGGSDCCGSVDPGPDPRK